MLQKQYSNLNCLEISRAALIQNMQQLHPHAKVAPVLKSNAYGHGITTVGPIFDSLQPPFLIVDSLYEAYELHKLRVKTPILIMGYTHPDNWQVKRLPFHVAVFDLETAAALHRYQPGCQVHIFIDTGMGREGVLISELPHFLEELKKMTKLNVVGLCSHLEDADNSTSSASLSKQVQQYTQAYQLVLHAGFDPVWRHIGASAGVLKIEDPLFNLYRVGLACYGISPLAKNDRIGREATLMPALRFTSTLAQIKQVPKGTSIGYNHTFITKSTTRIGIVPAGYYDGVDRRLSNEGVMKVRGEYCPIIGRVSMNMTTINLTNCPTAVVGDSVEIYSKMTNEPHSFVQAAHTAGTIPYELLVHLAESVKRVVV